MDTALAFEMFSTDTETYGELVGPETMYLPTTHVMIKPDGEWHRRGPEQQETACGETYSQCAVREYTLTGKLCEDCFTPYELAKARKALLAAAKR